MTVVLANNKKPVTEVRKAAALIVNNRPADASFLNNLCGINLIIIVLSANTPIGTFPI
jgi:hypothetical protein